MLTGFLSAEMRGGSAVRTYWYKRIRRPEFRTKLEQRQKRECGKDKGQKHPFDTLSRIFWVSASRRSTGEGGGGGGGQKWRSFEDWEVSYIGWDVVRSMILTAKTNLNMAADAFSLLPTLQYLDLEHTIWMAFMPGNQFFDVAQHYPERRVLFLSKLFCPKALHNGKTITCFWPITTESLENKDDSPTNPVPLNWKHQLCVGRSVTVMELYGKE